MKNRYGRKTHFTTPPVDDESTLAWKDHSDVLTTHSAGLDLSMYILLLTKNIKRYKWNRYFVNVEGYPAYCVSA